MPKGLRVATTMSLLSVMFLPLAFLPFGGHQMDGVPVSFAEFWQRGGGPVCAGIGVVGVLFSYGFIRARRWIRPIVVLLGWSMVIITLLDERALTVDLLRMFLVFGCLPVWYLYFRRPVREYFGVG